MGQEAAKLLSGSGMLPAQALIVTLLNEILSAPEPFLLILDDFHVIKSQPIIQAVQTLLDSQPPCLHLVIITREDPALPLPRFRVRNLMTEIRMDDLRFSLAETGSFLTASIGVKLKDEEVTALESRTEGWIAGLQLAALSFKGWNSEQVGEFIKDFSGSHRYIIDYLMEEVINRTDPDVRLFLTSTAVVDRFNAELADQLTGRNNSKKIIAHLEQTNLFLIPLDSECKWYRYHHLFAQFLRTELNKEEQKKMQRQAAEWFVLNGLPEEGIKYALAAGVYDQALNLLKTQASGIFQRGEMLTLLDWLNMLPAELIYSSGELTSYKAWSLFLLGKSEEAVHFLQRTEQIPPECMDPVAEGRLLALKGWIANYREDPRTKEVALLAIERLGDKDPFFREIALMSLGHAPRKNEPMAESTATLYMAYETALNAGHMFTCLGSLLDITMNLVIQGKRKESMELCNHALQKYTDIKGKTLPIAELLYIPLGILQYEGNELEQARHSLEIGIRASHNLGLNRILGGDAEQTLALVYWALGEIQKAWDLLAKAKSNIDSKAFPIIWDRYKAFEVHLMLKERDLEGASANSTGERGRYGRLVYVNIVSSLVLQSRGCQQEAIESMKEAVIFADSEGYVRPFLSEGSEVRELLFTVKSIRPEFVSSLLDSLSPSPRKPDGRSNTLSPFYLLKSEMVESLSMRELEVLRLLASGFSNEEIASKLFISLGTVKWHVKNIFSKLGVKSRTQAVAKAQGLGFLNLS